MAIKYLSSYDRNSLWKAVEEIGNEETTLIIDVEGVAGYDDDGGDHPAVTVDSNIILRFSRDGLLNTRDGKSDTLMLNGCGLEAGMFRIFADNLIIGVRPSSGIPKPPKTPYIHPEWFGAFPHRVDCTQAFQRAVNLAQATRGAVALFLSGGYYMVSDTIEIEDRITITGVNNKTSQIIMPNTVPATMACLHLKSDQCDSCRLSDFRILCAGQKGIGLRVGTRWWKEARRSRPPTESGIPPLSPHGEWKHEFSSRGKFYNLAFANLNVGLQLEAGITNMYVANEFYKCNTNIKLTYGPGATFYNPSLEGFKKYGIHLEESMAGIVKIDGGVIEGGDETAIAVKQDGGRLRIRDMWFEGNDLDLWVGGEDEVSECVLENCKFQRGVFDKVKFLRMNQFEHQINLNGIRITQNVRHKDIDFKITDQAGWHQMYIDNAFGNTSTKPVYSNDFSDVSFAPLGKGGKYEFLQNECFYLERPAARGLSVETTARAHLTGGKSIKCTINKSTEAQSVRFHLKKSFWRKYNYRDMTAVLRIRLDNSIELFSRRCVFKYTNQGRHQVTSFNGFKNVSTMNVGANNYFLCQIPISLEKAKKKSKEVFGDDPLTMVRQIDEIWFGLVIKCATGRLTGDERMYIDGIDIYPAGNISFPSENFSPPMMETKTNLLRLGDNKMVFSDRCPIPGEWKKGDIIFSRAPSSGANVGWVCVTAGNPGEWKGFGRIQ